VVCSWNRGRFLRLCAIARRIDVEVKDAAACHFHDQLQMGQTLNLLILTEAEIHDAARLPQTDGDSVVALLRRLGYEVVRTRGSHVQLKKTTAAGVHCVTVPSHKALVKGTLSDSISRVAGRRLPGKPAQSALALSPQPVRHDPTQSRPPSCNRYSAI